MELLEGLLLHQAGYLAEAGSGCPTIFSISAKVVGITSLPWVRRNVSNAAYLPIPFSVVRHGKYI
jgi:hypothetical protein